MKAYHFLREDMRAGEGDEPSWKIGETRSLPADREIIPCQYGYHASPSLWQALQYAPGSVACLVEIDGDIAEHNGDKYAARTRTLISAVDIKRELRLFAADCADHVLHFYESVHPDDDRPRKAIQAARDYAEGRIEAVAAWDAADAARNAAVAAWDAAVAAKNAAVAAADAADAARNAEIKWQRQRFDERFGHLFGGEA